MDFKHLSLAQWIDAEKYSDVLMAHKLISIFYINPKEYDDLELDKVSDWFDDQPSTKSFYLISQFFFIQKVLEIAMELYLKKEAKQMYQIERLIKINNKLHKMFGGRFWRTFRNTT